SYTRKPMSQRLAPFAVVSVLLAHAAFAQTAPATQPPPSAPGSVPSSSPAAQPAPPAAPVHTASGLPANTSSLSSADMSRLLSVLERIKTRMDDWLQLGRYQAANAQLAPAVAGEMRVVFLGDSITDNWQNPKFGGFFPGKPYVDRGISGQTTPQMV